jgi:hypothetical protein
MSSPARAKIRKRTARPDLRKVKRPDYPQQRLLCRGIAIQA